MRGAASRSAASRRRRRSRARKSRRAAPRAARSRPPRRAAARARQTRAHRRRPRLLLLLRAAAPLQLREARSRVLPPAARGRRARQTAPLRRRCQRRGRSHPAARPGRSARRSRHQTKQLHRQHVRLNLQYSPKVARPRSCCPRRCACRARRTTREPLRGARGAPSRSRAASLRLPAHFSNHSVVPLSPWEEPTSALQAGGTAADFVSLEEKVMWRRLCTRRAPIFPSAALRRERSQHELCFQSMQNLKCAGKFSRKAHLQEKVHVMRGECASARESSTAAQRVPDLCNEDSSRSDSTYPSKLDLNKRIIGERAYLIGPQKLMDHSANRDPVLRNCSSFIMRPLLQSMRRVSARSHFVSAHKRAFFTIEKNNRVGNSVTGVAPELHNILKEQKKSFSFFAISS
jgi:hypothetical protein